MIEPKLNGAWLIQRNVDRYPDSATSLTKNLWPNQIVVLGTLEQAEIVAERLSNWEAGCDYYFYVVGDEEGL